MKLTEEAKVLLGIGVLTLVIIIGAVFFLGKSSPTPTNTNAAPVDEKLLVRNDSYKIASDSAKVTIVEFGDYQCPACAAVHTLTKQVLKDYAGKVNFIYRHFPLPQHKNALISAEAAEAAGEQGKFWQMNDKLYETQDQWAENEKPLDIFTVFTKDLGLDTAKFQADVIANKYQDKINRDQNDGNSLKINSTPTFFINGQKLEGVSGYNDFKSKIDSLL